MVCHFEKNLFKIDRRSLLAQSFHRIGRETCQGLLLSTPVPATMTSAPPLPALTYSSPQLGLQDATIVTPSGFGIGNHQHCIGFRRLSYGTTTGRAYFAPPVPRGLYTTPPNDARYHFDTCVRSLPPSLELSQLLPPPRTPPLTCTLRPSPSAHRPNTPQALSP